MANFNYQDFASGYQPETLGQYGVWGTGVGITVPGTPAGNTSSTYVATPAANPRQSKIDPSWTQRGKDRKMRQAEEKRGWGYINEAKTIIKQFGEMGADYPGIIGGVERIRALKNAFMGLNRVDVTVHDAGFRVFNTAYKGAADVWNKFIRSTIAQMNPVLKSESFDQLSMAISNLASFRGNVTAVPPEFKPLPIYRTALQFMYDFKNKLIAAQTEAAKTQEEHGRITAKSKGEAEAIIEYQMKYGTGGAGGGKDPDDDKTDLTMPLILGGGALALLLALKG